MSLNFRSCFPPLFVVAGIKNALPTGKALVVLKLSDTRTYIRWHFRWPQATEAAAACRRAALQAVRIGALEELTNHVIHKFVHPIMNYYTVIISVDNNGNFAILALNGASNALIALQREGLVRTGS